MRSKILYLTLIGIFLLGAPVTFAREGLESTEVKLTTEKEAERTTELKMKTAARRAELEKKALEEKAKAVRVTEKRKERLDNGCEKTEEKINSVLARHSEAKEKHLANQNRLYARATALSVKLKAINLDTTKLDADLATFKVKIDTVKATFAVYSASLTATKQYTCGESEGAFKAQLRLSRDDYKEFKDALKDAREFWQVIVMADIKALRDLVVPSASPVN